MSLPNWNRKRVAAWLGAIVLSIWIPVAIDQAYFRYNAYILPVVGLLAAILYLGLVLTSHRMTQIVHSLHSQFSDRPLIHALIVGGCVGLLIVLIGAGEWTAVRASKAHVAELQAKDNPPLNTSLPPVIQTPIVTPIAEIRSEKGTKKNPPKIATPKEKIEVPTPRESATNFAPGGIANSGTINGPATVINPAPPPPKVTWSLRGSWPGREPNETVITVEVDRSIEVPAFSAKCDRPCETRLARAEGITQMKAALKTTDPSVAGFVLAAPRPLGAGTPIIWQIIASDSKEQAPGIIAVSIIPGDQIPK